MKKHNLKEKTLSDRHARAHRIRNLMKIRAENIFYSLFNHCVFLYVDVASIPHLINLIIYVSKLVDLLTTFTELIISGASLKTDTNFIIIMIIKFHEIRKVITIIITRWT